MPDLILVSERLLALTASELFFIERGPGESTQLYSDESGSARWASFLLLEPSINAKLTKYSLTLTACCGVAHHDVLTEWAIKVLGQWLTDLDLFCYEPPHFLGRYYLIT